MADLEMRLIGQPDEVQAVVTDLREQFDAGIATDIRSISAPRPCRRADGRVRVYIVFDGTALADSL